MEEWVQKAVDQINLFTNQLNPAQVEEIVLENIKIPYIHDKIKKKIESFPNLISLAINSCGLKDITNLPNLEKLNRLELAFNQIKGEDLVNLKKYKNLISLVLRGNKITDIKQIQDLKQYFEFKLLQIDLFETPITNKIDYRSQLFKIFANLIYVDNIGRNQLEIIIPKDNIRKEDLQDPITDHEDALEEENFEDNDSKDTAKAAQYSQSQKNKLLK